MRLTPEQIVHINIVSWFHHDFPDMAQDLHHFANERRCSMQQGRLLKKMGVKKGVSDFFLAIPMNGKSGLWIELKVGKGKLSQEQIYFLERKTARGYMAVSVWGEEAAKLVILSYLNKYNRRFNMTEQDTFDEVKQSIDKTLEEIKKHSPELYEHLKKSIIMDEKTKTFGYFPT